MAKPTPRQVTVISKQQLSPNMIKITLGGEQLQDFPEGQESGYIKLVLPEKPINPDSGSLLDAMTRLFEQKKVRMRSYTIRAFDKIKSALTLEFVAHGDNGHASAWAMNAAIGDEVIIIGPGTVKLMDPCADWFFIAGDMTALPAISVNLEKLPRHARGYAVIEIIHEEDKQAIDAPVGIDIHWVINPHPDQVNTCLADAVRAQPWREGTVNVWVASEFETMRNLRRYFKQERKVNRNDIYASSYWKMGETDEGNKAAKKSDPEADI